MRAADTSENCVISRKLGFFEKTTSFRESYVISRKPCRFEKIGISLKRFRCYVGAMNKNCPHCTNSKRTPNFFIPRSEIPFEVENRRYVEFVCDILVQGRFGPGRVSPCVIDPSNNPELESLLFPDLHDVVARDDGLALRHDRSPLGRIADPDCLYSHKFSGTHDECEKVKTCKSEKVMRSRSPTFSLFTFFTFVPLGRGSP